MGNIYNNGTYWKANEGFHEEDAAFKLKHAYLLLAQHGVEPRSIVDMGCGSGKTLRLLCDHFKCRGMGYDISREAIAHAQQWKTDTVDYAVGDVSAISEKSDLAVMFDVFEHVDDYLGFLRQARGKGKYTLFNIPIDMFTAGVLLEHYMDSRQRYGHLHYFSKESALATLDYAGYKVLNCRIADGSWHAFKREPGLMRLIQLILSGCISPFSAELKMKLVGGSSLMVLAK